MEYGPLSVQEWSQSHGHGMCMQPNIKNIKCYSSLGGTPTMYHSYSHVYAAQYQEHQVLLGGMSGTINWPGIDMPELLS